MRNICAIILVCCFSYVQSSSLVLPHHANLTQSADVACWKIGTKYYLKVFLTKNEDNIDLVYTASYFDSSVSIGSFDSNGNGIEGNGTAENPYTFTITGTGDLPGTPISLSSTEINDKLAYVKSPDVIGVNVISKAIYEAPFLHNVIFPDDVRYEIYCNYTDIGDNFITSGQIVFTGAIAEAGYLLDDSATLEVLFGGSPTNSVSLGNDILLSVKTNEPTRSTGVYVHSCYICDQINCSGIRLNFIDSNGCNTSDYFTGFERHSDVSARTMTFPAFAFSTQSEVFFGCSVNFCYDNNDAQCDNYCAFKSQGRKKRQASDAQPDREITTYIRITDSAQTSPQVGKGEDSLSTLLTSPGEQSQQEIVLLGAVISLSALLLLGIIAFFVIFYRTTRQKSTE